MWKKKKKRTSATRDAADPDSGRCSDQSRWKMSLIWLISLWNPKAAAAKCAQWMCHRGGLWPQCCRSSVYMKFNDHAVATLSSLSLILKVEIVKWLLELYFDLFFCNSVWNHFFTKLFSFLQIVFCRENCHAVTVGCACWMQLRVDQRFVKCELWK